MGTGGQGSEHVLQVVRVGLYLHQGAGAYGSQRLFLHLQRGFVVEEDIQRRGNQVLVQRGVSVLGGLGLGILHKDVQNNAFHFGGLFRIPDAGDGYQRQKQRYKDFSSHPGQVLYSYG